VISYGLTVLAGGLGLVAGLAFHTVFRLSLQGGAAMPPAAGRGRLNGLQRPAAGP
jgi:hypothetical protein